MSPTPPRTSAGRTVLWLNAWNRRVALRLWCYVAVLVVCVLAVAERYAHWLNSPPLRVPTPIGTGLTVWFRLEDDSLVPIEAEDASGAGMKVTYWNMWNTRGHPSGRFETRTLGIKVLSVEPEGAAERARACGIDLPLAIAEAHWFDAGLKTTIVRPSDDSTVVFLRAQDRTLLHANARRFAMPRAVCALIALAVAIGVGEFAALAGRRMFPAGHCPRCGYPLTDLPTPVCPECGRIDG